MSQTIIKSEDWVITRTCPNCLRPREIKNTIRRHGLNLYMEVDIPSYCVWCEIEKDEAKKSKGDSE